MNKNLKKPCDTCRRAFCSDRDCKRWRRWFKESWNREIQRLRQAAWEQKNRIGKQQHPNKFFYRAPAEIKNPCEACECREWCVKPCSLRYAWWNHQIKKVRDKIMGGGTR